MFNKAPNFENFAQVNFLKSASCSFHVFIQVVLSTRIFRSFSVSNFCMRINCAPEQVFKVFIKSWTDVLIKESVSRPYFIIPEQFTEQIRSSIGTLCIDQQPVLMFSLCASTVCNSSYWLCCRSEGFCVKQQRAASWKHGHSSVGRTIHENILNCTRNRNKAVLLTHFACYFV